MLKPSLVNSAAALPGLIRTSIAGGSSLQTKGNPCLSKALCPHSALKCSRTTPFHFLCFSFGLPFHRLPAKQALHHSFLIHASCFNFVCLVLSSSSRVQATYLRDFRMSVTTQSSGLYERPALANSQD